MDLLTLMEAAYQPTVLLATYTQAPIFLMTQLLAITTAVAEVFNRSFLLKIPSISAERKQPVKGMAIADKLVVLMILKC